MSVGAVPVFTDASSYRSAIAELPLSTRLVADPAGAIVVLAGSGARWNGVKAAVAAGARAIVIDEPGDISANGADLPVDVGVPVFMARARIRADVVADAVAGRAGAIARVFAVDAAALPDEARAVMRDAIGWVRALAGGPLVLRAARSNARGASALLERSGLSCSIGLGILGEGRLGGMLRVSVLGETTSDISIDIASGFSSVATSTAEGRWEAPTRYETVERSTLRRALAAFPDGGPAPDLADFAHDDALTRSILDSS